LVNEILFLNIKCHKTRICSIASIFVFCTTTANGSNLIFSLNFLLQRAKSKTHRIDWSWLGGFVAGHLPKKKKIQGLRFRTQGRHAQKGL
jgi:hypothetical protein